MTEREFAIDVVRTLQKAGHQALWAGGCVRDELLGLVPNDYDVAADARPDEVQRLFYRTVAVGASFGVIEVLGPRLHGEFLRVEVATFRSEVSYSDGRHPDAVVFSSAREDALRRDFTFNGMFFDPLTGTLHDYVGGQADLQAHILRAIGDPRQRFAEDKLRLLRAVRFAARFDLTIEPATAEAIVALADTLPVVSAERIANEIRQLLVHPQRVRALTLMSELGLLRPILPEVEQMKGLPQGPPAAPTGDLWEHAMAVLDLIGPEPSFPLALAALLHDVGKPRVVSQAGDKYTFYHHEHVGARIAHDICSRLKLSNHERVRTVWLVEKHQYLSEVRQMRTSKIKTMLAHPGIRELLCLHRADALASNRSVDHVGYCEFLLKGWTQDDLNPPPLITGHDLTRHGLEPGPLFKELLEAVREAQLDGQIKTTPQALALVDRLVRAKFS
jgi:poly(A) polymerase